MSKLIKNAALEIKYPIRINRFLALNNYCTRKGADELIIKKLVTINGEIAVLGDKVQKEDFVEVSSEGGSKTKKYLYLAYNKPAGIVTNLPQGDEESIADITHFPRKVFAIGRLDKDSRGLLIFTDDGRITDKLLNPAYAHEKEYKVTVNAKIQNDFTERMQSGVKLDDGYRTKECKVQKTSGNSFTITLTEGKNRQIRRMCRALGYEVVELVRIRIMNVILSDIKEGEFRKIKGEALDTFLNSLGITNE